MRNRCPTASDDTEQVELDHPHPHLIARLFECAVVSVAAGHVDQDVDAAEFGGCLRKGLFHRGRIGDIQPDSHMAAALVRKSRSHFLGRGLIKVGDRNMCAFFG